MAFERFTNVGRAFRPRASIRATGQIGFNQGAVRRFELTKWPYVVLFYDRDGRRIGLKLTKDTKEEGIMKLTTRGGNAAISARSFLDYYNIDHAKTRQFDMERDQESGMLAISLS